LCSRRFPFAASDKLIPCLLKRSHRSRVPGLQEKKQHILVHDLKPPFLDGRTVFTKQQEMVHASTFLLDARSVLISDVLFLSSIRYLIHLMLCSALSAGVGCQGSDLGFGRARQSRQQNAARAPREAGAIENAQQILVRSSLLRCKNPSSSLLIHALLCTALRCAALQQGVGGQQDRQCDWRQSREERRRRWRRRCRQQQVQQQEVAPSPDLWLPLLQFGWQGCKRAESQERTRRRRRR